MPLVAIRCHFVGVRLTSSFTLLSACPKPPPPRRWSPWPPRGILVSTRPWLCHRARLSDTLGD
ncbi:hypothetical protein E2562_026684 [Oryza meyeriana var. granulata]|uniref:Uncharacterized protein n=1 Tax=Oryza meyeriana var. granulata TaxID=110450 RepID=A0A6G1E243_9ORYZ|nr:hypothetical protein E2562_026684 [Oryza meyeriana var. granulata]